MSETSGSGMRCRHGNDPFCCGICRNEEIESLRAQLLAARAEALEEEANATSDLLNALAEDCEKAIAAHRISAFHEFPQTCGGCHWWAGFAGALTEIRFRRQNPEQVMHPAIAALRAKGGGK